MKRKRENKIFYIGSGPPEGSGEGEGEGFLVVPEVEEIEPPIDGLIANAMGIESKIMPLFAIRETRSREIPIKNPRIEMTSKINPMINCIPFAFPNFKMLLIIKTAMIMAPRTTSMA